VAPAPLQAPVGDPSTGYSVRHRKSYYTGLP